MSARTGGLILLQLLFDLTRAGGRADRVLDAPTNEAWIDPWVEHLRARGVDLRLGAPVAGDRIRRAAGSTGARRRRAATVRPTTTSPRCRSRACARCCAGVARGRAAARRASTGSSRAG